MQHLAALLGDGERLALVVGRADLQQLAAPLQREAELLAAANERNLAQDERGVAAMAARRLVRLHEESAPLVVTDRLDVDPRGLRQAANRHRLWHLLVHLSDIRYA